MPPNRSALLTASLLGALNACHHPAPSTAPAPDPAAEAARRAIASEASIRADQTPEASLGVAPFAVATADTTVAPLAYGLADLLVTDLAQSARLQVVDRTRLDALLRELRLAGTGRVDSATAPRVGRLVGARRIVVGSLAGDAAGGLRVDLRVANSATGRVQPVTSARTTLANVLDAEKELAFRTFAALGITLTPAEQAAVEQRPTRSVTALLAYSRGVRADALGDSPTAVASYRAALAADPSFALARTHLSAAAARAGAPRVAARAPLGRAVTLANLGLNPSGVTLQTENGGTGTGSVNAAVSRQTPPTTAGGAGDVTTVIIHVHQVP